MDAAHRLTIRAGLLFLTALLMVAPGLAQPTLQVATSVTLAGTGGQNLNVTSSGDAITYTIGAPVYSADNNGVHWLGVTGGTTTPATLSFNVIATAGLAQGTHTATVTLTPTPPPAGVQPVTITVTFSSGNPGGGGTGTLTAFPSPVNVSASSGSQFTTSVSITTTSTTAITLGLSTSITTGGTNWLSAAFSGVSSVVVGSPATIQVTANAFNLPNGSYQGTLTVTPISPSGAALNIPVNFTVGGSSGGNGSWTVTPNSIPFTYTTGGNFPNPVNITVMNNVGASTYSAAATSSNGWLLINGSQQSFGLVAGAAYAVSVGAQAASLSTGTYNGTVTISDNNGTTQASVGVTLTVNGGNSSGLTISPNPLSLSSVVNGPQQNQTVSITSSTGGTLSVSASLQTWISYQLPSNTAIPVGGTTAITINVNPSGLSTGNYSQTLNITVGSQSAVLTVNLAVGTSGGGSNGTVLPTALSFTYQVGTPASAVAQQRIVIPAGSWTSSVTTSTGGTWLQVSPSAGVSVPDATSSPVVSINPTNLTVGSYSGTVSITTGGSVQNVGVTLTVTSSTVFVPTPGDLIFVAQTGTTTPGQAVFFNMQVSDIQATSNNSWITVAATPGSMSVNVDPTGMAAGVYSGSITLIVNSAANTPYTYPVLMIVNGGGSSNGPLSFNPTTLSFTSNNGVTTPIASNLTVSASAQTNFTYSTSVFGGVNNWIVVSPANSGSGVTTTNLSVSVNPAGLAVGSYSGTITFLSNGFTQTVAIGLTVSTSGGTNGNVTVNPTSLNFSGASGATTIPAQSISVTSASGSAPVTFTVTPTTTSGGSWLSSSASTSNTTPSTINVTANPTGLTAGTYNGNLAIQPTGGTLVNLPVTLTIAPPPQVSASPTSLTFSYRAGDSNPASQSVNVTGTGLTFSATAASTGNWLSVSPATGTAPATVSVSINGTGLTPGTYNGTVTIAGTGGAGGSTTVNVTLTVTAPLPTITKVTNSASYAVGPLSPGEIITLFAGDPAHPIGPATPAGLTIDSSTGLVSTTIGGVQVLINGFACPMIYASASQVSAVVPYQLAQFTTATVLVKFLGQSSNGVSMNVTTTAPGLFTANSSGTGPGAILNSNNSVNSPANPATRGDTVVVYMTGEGQTSPAGVTGKVTTVSSTPPLTPAPLLPVTITVGGQGANYSFAGQAPGFVSGVMQVNVVLPTNIPTGEQEIIISVGGNPSQRGVTVSVK
jgi:uncharacterized protein (TIGR03437 family)